MLDYSYLLSISIILISTKFLGSITEKINLPQVVGALVAGILIGPAAFNIVHDTSFLDSVSQIGVIILMFMAGLDTDIGQLKSLIRCDYTIDWWLYSLYVVLPSKSR